MILRVVIAMEIRLSNLIAPAFLDLHKDVREGRHANYWLKGGRGSTKSSFISLEIILGIMSDDHANAIVLRKVANTLRDSVFDQYLWAIDALGVSAYWRDSVSPMLLTYIPTGQQIRFKGADKPEKVKSQKFRHGYIKYKHYEEVDGFNGEAELRSINQSLNRGGSGIMTFYSYNPPSSQNSWVNQAVIQQGLRSDTVVHSSDYRTVPKQWLGKEFLADAEQLKKDNPKAYAHEYLGEVTGTGAEVFTNLRIKQISDDVVMAYDRIHRGLDFGFANDPLAYVEMQFEPRERKLYIYREYYGVGIKNREAVNVISKYDPNNDIIYGDAASPNVIAEYRDLGVNVVGAKKGAGSRDFGFKWLQDLREIVIDPIRCPNATREFSTYELARDNMGGFKHGYPDGNDHTIDATRYAMRTNMIRGGFRAWK